MYVFGGINGCIGKTAVAVNLFNISQLKKYVLMKKKILVNSMSKI